MIALQTLVKVGTGATVKRNDQLFNRIHYQGWHGATYIHGRKYATVKQNRLYSPIRHICVLLEPRGFGLPDRTG